jgi:TP901 family phage tail tape measure protein
MQFTLGIRLSAVDRMSSVINRAGKGIQKFSDKNRAMFERFRTASFPMIAAGTAMVGAVGLITNEAVAFQKAIYKAASLARVTGPTLEKLREEMSALALDLGPKLGMMPVQLGDIMEQTIQAGVEPLKNNRMSKEYAAFVENVTRLSKVAGVAPAEAVLNINTALGAFKKTFDKALVPMEKRVGLVTDALGVGAASSVVSVKDLTESLKMVGPQAQMLGMNLNETVAILMGFAEAGLRGTVAATAFRQTVGRLTTLPTKPQAKAMAALGFDPYIKGSGKLKPVGKMILELARSTEGLTDKQKAYALGAMFQARAVSSGVAFLDKSKVALDKFLPALAQGGMISQMFGQQIEAAGGRLDQANAQFSVLKITIAENLLPTLTDLLIQLTPMIKQFGEWVKKNPKLVENILKAVVAIGLFNIGVGGALGVLGNLGHVLGMLPYVFQAIALALPYAPFILFGTAVMLATVALVRFFKDGVKLSESGVPGIEQLAKLFEFIGEKIGEFFIFVLPKWGAVIWKIMISPFVFLQKVIGKTVTMVLTGITDLWNRIPAPVRNFMAFMVKTGVGGLSRIFSFMGGGARGGARPGAAETAGPGGARTPVPPTIYPGGGRSQTDINVNVRPAAGTAANVSSVDQKGKQRPRVNAGVSGLAALGA